MTTLKEELWTTLEELTDKQLKEFKWFLKAGGVDGGSIPEARLEGADRQDTVDLMVQKYHDDGAATITVQILQKLSRNDLAQRLRTRGLLESRTNKDKLQDTTAKIQQMIEEREKKIGEIKKVAETSREAAEQQIINSERSFALLHQYVDESLRDLKAEIEKKQRNTQEEANGMIQRLERELSELAGSTKKEMPPYENHTNLIAQFSQNNWTEVSVSPPSYGRTVLATVSLLKEKLTQQMETLQAKAKLIRAQQFAVDVTLDPNTAHPNLILSHDRKRVHSSDVKQNLPDGPNRFNVAVNVLATQSFSSGRFYYEAQVEGKTSWDLGFVQESINRRGSITLSPENGSWTIGLRPDGKYIASTVHLAVKSLLRKVGVFADYENRSICFFDVDSANIVHYFKDCSFKGKLLPFFCPGPHKGGQNASPLIICNISNNN